MLKVENIHKSWPGFAIKAISFEVDKGDYFILLGRSGSGKTALLEIIAGMTNPDSGKLILKGKDITHLRIQNRNIGMVFQELAIFPHMKIKDNIAYPLKHKKLSSHEIDNRVVEIAEKFNISHILNRKPAKLSGGELQRAALARTLIRKPDLLLLDEPLSSLDVQLKQDIRKLLKQINREGTTVIHVTHDYEEAILLANKIAVLNRGKLIQTGSTKDVFQHPASVFVANFTGVKNYFRSRFSRIEGKQLYVASIDKRIDICTTHKPTSEEGYIIIRCEDITINLSKTDSSAVNQFEGRITGLVQLPHFCEVMVDIGIQMVVSLSEDSVNKLHLEANKKVWLSFKATAVRIIQ